MFTLPGVEDVNTVTVAAAAVIEEGPLELMLDAMSKSTVDMISQNFGI